MMLAVMIMALMDLLPIAIALLRRAARGKNEPKELEVRETRAAA